MTLDGLETLISASVIIGVGFIVMISSRTIKISPIIGFLIAGLLLGEHGLGFIHENKATHLVAEMGVVFLLFDIGLHFSFRSAWKMRQDLLAVAPIQLGFCGLVFCAIAMLSFSMPLEIAIIFGLTLGLSSTAVVVQILSDLKQSNSPLGKTGKAILIFQDIAAIFLLILADAVASGDNTPVGYHVGAALIKTAISLVTVMGLGYFILTPLMKAITRFNDSEMFTFLSLSIVCVTALGTAWAGLSLTLGAFLAGMVLGETPFRVLLQTELRPFRSLLLAFFFITVGAFLNPQVLIQNTDIVLSLTAMIILAKFALIAGILLIFKRPKHQIIELSVLLAQGSEFAFVIFGMATVKAGLGEGLSQQIVAAIALSMMISPMLMIPARKAGLKICDMLEETICNKELGLDTNAHQPVFIIGMNDVGQTLARGLKAHDIPYIAVDYRRERFLEAIAAGYTVAYGEPADMRFWKTLGVIESQAIAIATPRYEVAKDLSPVIRQLYPTLTRYVSVNHSEDAEKFAALGYIPFLNRGMPSGLTMAISILQDLGISEEKMNIWIEDEQSSAIEALSPKAEDINIAQLHAPEINATKKTDGNTQQTGNAA